MMHSPNGKNIIAIFHEVGLLKVSKEGIIRDSEKKVRRIWMSKWWRIWAKSLGEKVGETDKQANTVAVIRTVWWVTHMATCWFIILNAIANHGWHLIGL